MAHHEALQKFDVGELGALVELPGMRPHEGDVAGDAPSAVGAARRGLEINPSSPVATYAMAEALAALGDPGAWAWQRRLKKALTR